MTDDIKVIVENEVIEVGVVSREVTVVTTAIQGPPGPPGPPGLLIIDGGFPSSSGDYEIDGGVL